MIIQVAGMDPSLSNWGIAIANLDLSTGQMTSDPFLDVIQTEPSKVKSVRKNSDDLFRAQTLAEGMYEHVEFAKAVFVEVPVGSQSARAMASYGVCVGLLGSLKARGVEIIEVTPAEVKIAMTGDKTASKTAMIEAAVKLYPKAPWPTHRGIITLSKCEHMADAIAAIHAGVNTPAFSQIRRILGY
ncbi:RuvC-like resolvase [Stenotrophomonas phage C121]|uniref:RuvC-like Holliday junction resolvase n=1 Tax=Stenotrophomonas phage C121 TaxID=2914029 RepID=UPI00232912F0|nr:RuvC-like Holliday junction resolvase [Stenotrophomonas phage C121]UKL14804.1 RuvC-like resolvase [Stenotrophomonas phage C121]